MSEIVGFIDAEEKLNEFKFLYLVNNESREKQTTSRLQRMLDAGWLY
jgi:hypothetical protein